MEQHQIVFGHCYNDHDERPSQPFDHEFGDAKEVSGGRRHRSFRVGCETSCAFLRTLILVRSKCLGPCHLLIVFAWRLPFLRAGKERQKEDRDEVC